MYLIENEMGSNFIQPPAFDLAYSIRNATPLTPLIFILFPGADPRLEILKIAEQQDMKSSFM